MEMNAEFKKDVSEIKRTLKNTLDFVEGGFIADSKFIDKLEESFNKIIKMAQNNDFKKDDLLSIQGDLKESFELLKRHDPDLRKDLLVSIGAIDDMVKSNQLTDQIESGKGYVLSQTFTTARAYTSKEDCEADVAAMERQGFKVVSKSHEIAEHYREFHKDMGDTGVVLESLGSVPDGLKNNELNQQLKEMKQQIKSLDKENNGLKTFMNVIKNNHPKFFNEVISDMEQSVSTKKPIVEETKIETLEL
ncbi:hypothetical protein ACDX77_19210 [Bacillus velezensis]|uniref:hypothetical protein n=1 Tax=Bacillus velezensis TaxID=492670 RepID=UPI0035568EC9